MSFDLFKWIRATAAVAALLLCASAIVAEEGEDGGDPDWFPGEFSANVTTASEYVFRGISQSNERASIQGGIDWAMEFRPEIGIYAGGWASNVNFGDGDQASAEFDIYGGIAGSIGDFSYDFTTIYYEYPGAPSNLRYDYWELGPSIGYDFGVASVSAQYLWSPDFFAGSGDGHYVTGGLEVPVPASILPEWLAISVSSNVGAQYIDEESTFGARDYVHFDVGSTLSVFGLDVDLRFHDTDLNRSTCFGGADLCDSRFVVGVSKSF